MAPTAQSKKAAESAAQARKVAADARTTVKSMAEPAASIADQIEGLQHDAEDSVFNKKMVEIQEEMKAQQINSDKRFLDTAHQLKTLIEALNLRPDAVSVDTEAVVEKDPEKAAERLAISHAVHRAKRKGGIPGYCRERKLNDDKDKLRNLYVSLGVCYATADELFRGGLDSVGELTKMETSKQVQYALLNINKKKTSLCPEKYKVYIGQGSIKSLITFIEW